MNGYAIEYINTDGEREHTFMGEPMCSPGIKSSSNKDMIVLMFGFAHPGCKILCMEPCTYEAYERKHQ